MNDFKKFERILEDVWHTAQRTAPDNVIQRRLTVPSKVQELFEVLEARSIKMNEDGILEARPLISQQVGTIERGAQVTGVKIDRPG